MSSKSSSPLKQALYTAAFGAADIGRTWAGKLYGAATAKSDEARLLEELVGATNYEDWWAAATALDDVSGKYDWRVNPIDDMYDYRLIEERRKELNRLRRNDNVIAVANCLRQGLLRNLFNITRLPLYDKAYAGTKDNIQWYIEESVEAIRFIADSPTSSTTGEGHRLTAQEKLDVLYDSRKSFGCTALLLQGGSIFGLCHIGVMKALLEHGILPKVIVGTATGAVIAALAGVHTIQELPAFLNGDSIDLGAFTEATLQVREQSEAHAPSGATRVHDWADQFQRRAWRLLQEGLLIDPHVLEECIKANIGDITFREAFERTSRILNIIISSPSEEIPNLMNYLTAPDVLIRSAAMASHITNMSRIPKSGFQLLYKESDGSIRRFDFRPGDQPANSTRRPPTATDPRKTPLARLRQQFNIDHVIISQARPYIAPFLKPSLPYIRNPPTGISAVTSAPTRLLPSLPDLGAVFKHGLLLADILGVLPDSLRRVLSDELVQGDSLTVVPELHLDDYRRLLANPSRDEVRHWIRRGERAVWPSLCALKVRCMIEVALDQAYERVRRRGAEDPFPLLLAQIDSRPPPALPTQDVAAVKPLAGGAEGEGRVEESLLGGELVDSDGEGKLAR